MECAFTVVTEFSSSSGEEEYPKGEVVSDTSINDTTIIY